MSATSGAQGFGFEDWLRPLREAMTGSQFPTGAASMPGFSAWPGMGGWPGPMAGPAGFGMGMPSAFSSAAGPFSGLFEQLSTLAQGQWQQLAAGVAGGATGSGEALSGWHSLLESLAPAAAIPAAAMPGMDAAKWREALSTPQVGPMREHVERWQQALLAELDQQEASRALSAQLGEILKLALEHFRERLAARAEPGKQIGSMRELFDEWIEAGEQAWAERASGDAFTAALGQYSNARMRVRAAQADQINRIAEQLGLPTRAEVDSDHRRIAQMERELRRVQRELDALRGAADSAVPAAAVRTASPARKRPATKATARASAAPAKQAASRTRKVHPKPAQKRSAGVAPAAKAVAGDKKAKPTRARRSKAPTFPIVAAPRAIGSKSRKAASKPAARKRATP